MGQTLSLFADPQAYAETTSGEQDAGMMDTLDVRRPQVRYTWLLGNGLSIAGAVEEPTYNNPTGGPFADAADGGKAVAVQKIQGSSSVYYNWPHVVLAPEWDQPWGHVKFAAAGGVMEADTAPTGVLATQARHQFAGYAFTLTGHLNTWGKDALRGGVVFDHGAADYLPGMVEAGRIYNDGTGAFTTLNAWAGYVNYEHFFTGQWRANAAFGYDHEYDTNPGFASPVTLASIDKTHLTSEVNVIYSPVPQTDFVLEWDHAYRKMVSGADSTDDEIAADAIFYF
jgi:hypothetical protein